MVVWGVEGYGPLSWLMCARLSPCSALAARRREMALQSKTAEVEVMKREVDQLMSAARRLQAA